MGDMRSRLPPVLLGQFTDLTDQYTKRYLKITSDAKKKKMPAAAKAMGAQFVKDAHKIFLDYESSTTTNGVLGTKAFCHVHK
eukprot:1662685-Pyramimonas_sp.AAC.1